MKEITLIVPTSVQVALGNYGGAECEYRGVKYTAAFVHPTMSYSRNGVAVAWDNLPAGVQRRFSNAWDTLRQAIEPGRAA